MARIDVNGFELSKEELTWRGIIGVRPSEHDWEFEAFEGLQGLATVMIWCVVDYYDSVLLPVFPFLLEALV